MQEQITQLNRAVEKLTNRVVELEKLVNMNGASFYDYIRDIILVDIDKDQTHMTESIPVTTGGGGADVVVAGKIPDAMGLTYYRGKAYHVALYELP